MAEQGFGERSFAHGGATRAVFDKGPGLPVLVLHELPGLAQACVDFADRLVAAGFHVYLPLLVGRPLQDAALCNLRRLCISAEFARLKAGEHAPVTDWLRALAGDISRRHGGHKVGGIGMCMTGAFVIPLVIDPWVAAGVVSQPSIPFSIPYRAAGLGAGPWMRQLNISDEQLQEAVDAARSQDKALLVQHFADDRLCPRERIERIAAAFGAQAEVHTYEEPSRLRRLFDPPHALLTEEYDRAGDADHATRVALQRVVAFLQQHLGAPAQQADP